MLLLVVMQNWVHGLSAHVAALNGPWPARLLMQWVADCVLHGQFPVSRELKMAFQLLPLPVGAGATLLFHCRTCLVAWLTVRPHSSMCT